MLPISSWPDLDALPPDLKNALRETQHSDTIDNTSLADLYARKLTVARIAEARRATGLSTVNPRKQPNWIGDIYGSGDASRSVASSASPQFPQLWVMADRIARYIAKQAQERVRHDASGAFRRIQWEAMSWIRYASTSGLNDIPDPDEQAQFSAWLGALFRSEDVSTQTIAQNAARLGMENVMVQYLGDAPDAARRVPARYYEDLRISHPWRSKRHYHQMLGNAPSSQKARSVERNDVLLLQLQSDDGVGFMFCDLGEVEFWIDRDDLAARRFDRARAATCGG